VKYSWIIIGIILLASCEQNPSKKLVTSDVPAEETNVFDSLNSEIKSDPGNSQLYYQRAVNHYAHRDLASSLSDVGRALKLDSSNVEYYMLLSNLKMLSKQSREARNALIRANELEPKNIDVLLKLGELYMLVEDFKNSFGYLNQVLEVDIHNATAYRLKGFNYKYAGDTVKAVSSFQTAIEQDPNDYDSYLQLGLLYSIYLDPLAIDYYNNALKVNPNSLEALYAKGLHLQREFKSREALEVYARIAELNADYFNAYYNSGYIYLEQLQVYDSAALFFSQAIDHGPERYFQAMYNRGLAYERLQDFKNAKLNYTEVLGINPQYDLAALGLSRLEEME